MHPAARCGAVLRQPSPRSWLLQPDQGRRLPRPGYTAWSGCDNPNATGKAKIQLFYYYANDRSCSSIIVTPQPQGGVAEAADSA